MSDSLNTATSPIGRYTEFAYNKNGVELSRETFVSKREEFDSLSAVENDEEVNMAIVDDGARSIARLRRDVHGVFSGSVPIKNFE